MVRTAVPSLGRAGRACVRAVRTHSVPRGAPQVTAKAADTSLSDAAASASTSYVYTHAFHHTDGRTASAGIFRANGSVVGFNVEAPMCWYLDSLFCSSVHGLKSSMGSAEALTLVQVSECTYKWK